MVLIQIIQIIANSLIHTAQYKVLVINARSPVRIKCTSVQTFNTCKEHKISFSENIGANFLTRKKMQDYLSWINPPHFLTCKECKISFLEYIGADFLACCWFVDIAIKFSESISFDDFSYKLTSLT